MQARAELAPDDVSLEGQREPFSVETAMGLLSSAGTDLVTMHLIRRQPPEIIYSLGFLGSRARIGFWLSASMPLSSFSTPARSRSLVDLVGKLSESCHPEYGFAHSGGDHTAKSDPHRLDPYALPNVYEAYWLNLYGPELIENIGRKRVLQTPSVRMEPLAWGGVLWLTSWNPQEYATAATQALRARALHHLLDHP